MKDVNLELVFKKKKKKNWDVQKIDQSESESCLHLPDHLNNKQGYKVRLRPSIRLIFFFCLNHCIDDVMVISVLASSAEDRGFKPCSGQTKDYEIGICCFSSKQAVLKRKSKDWLGRNQNNVSEWSDMSIDGLLFQWQNGPYHHLIES